MSDANQKIIKPDDMEPVVPGAKDAGPYPGNAAGTVQSTPAVDKGDEARKKDEPTA